MNTFNQVGLVHKRSTEKRKPPNLIGTFVEDPKRDRRFPNPTCTDESDGLDFSKKPTTARINSSRITVRNRPRVVEEAIHQAGGTWANVNV